MDSAVIAAAILAVAVALLLRTSSRAVALSLAVVAGGAAGNLADRLFRTPGLGRGAVADWIHVAFYPPTFNLADGLASPPVAARNYWVLFRPHAVAYFLHPSLTGAGRSVAALLLRQRSRDG